MLLKCGSNKIFRGSLAVVAIFSRIGKNKTAAQPPGFRDGVTTGGVFIGNNFIERGVELNGAANARDPIPPDFFGRPGTRIGVGLASDFDGYNVNQDLRIDFVAPGTADEVIEIGNDVDNERNQADTVTLFSPASGGEGYRATGSIDTLNYVVESTLDRVDDRFMKTVVTVTNTGTEPATNVRYVRAIDNDGANDAGAGFDAKFSIPRTIPNGDFVNVVVGQETGCSSVCVALGNEPVYAFYLSADPRSSVNFGNPGTSTDAFRDYGTFNNMIGDNNGAGTNTYQAIVFDEPELAAGASTTFVYYTYVGFGDVSDGINEVLDTTMISNSPSMVPSASQVPSAIPTLSSLPSMFPTLASSKKLSSSPKSPSSVKKGKKGTPRSSAKLPKSAKKA